MKRNIIYILLLSMLTVGCHNHKQEEKDGHQHSHEGCNHSHEEENHNHDEHQHNHDGCSHSHEGEENKHESENEKSHETEEIIFTQNQAEEAGLKIEKIQPGTFHQVIKTGGQIVSAQGDESIVSAPVGGIVSFGKRSLSEGATVTKGESLLNISSKNMESGDIVAKTRTTFEVAQKEFLRAESLIKDKLISEKEYNQIKLEYQNAKLAYEAIGKSNGQAGVSVNSSIGGFVKSKLVNEGGYVEMGTPLLVITQNRRLQLKADVSERYYADLSQIVSANFQTPYDGKIYNLSFLNGKLISFGKSSKDNEFYIPVTFEFDNIGNVLSGSYVEVFLLSKEKNNIISVPLSALLEEQDNYFVYIRLDEEGYKKQEVKTGANDGLRIEILSGLKTGDEVVTQGAYRVKMASLQTSVPHGHSH